MWVYVPCDKSIQECAHRESTKKPKTNTRHSMDTVEYVSFQPLPMCNPVPRSDDVNTGNQAIQ